MTEEIMSNIERVNEVLETEDIEEDKNEIKMVNKILEDKLDKNEPLISKLILSFLDVNTYNCDCCCEDYNTLTDSEICYDCIKNKKCSYCSNLHYNNVSCGICEKICCNDCGNLQYCHYCINKGMVIYEEFLEFRKEHKRAKIFKYRFKR